MAISCLAWGMPATEYLGQNRNQRQSILPMSEDRIPFLADVSSGPPQPLVLKGWEPGTFESNLEAFKSGLSNNPIAVLNRNGGMAQAMLAGTDYEEALDSDMGINGLEVYAESKDTGANRKLSREDQERIIRENGFEGKIKPNDFYTAEVLQTIMDARNDAEYAGAIHEMSNCGVTDFLAGLSAGFLDPLNLAVSFVPVPGMNAGKIAGWLANAGSFGGRTAIRAGQGLASGALGMAYLEPIIASGQTNLDIDYTLVDSLHNIAFGAIMGASLHPVAGGFGEW